jgi:hypothetical protein
MSRSAIIFSITTALALTGCASLPNGPGVMVLPGNGLSFEQFRNDDAICQQFAYAQVGGTTANQASVNSGVTSAAVGTVLGAAAGAAIGGGGGAAIGAGTGLVAGSMVGTGAASSSLYAAQERYDAAYIQCMYAKGHQVPVSGRFTDIRPQIMPPDSNIPLPPPGSPPPPPPSR